MKIINLYGGPGCGKSTTAAGLFSLMKMEGEHVELVTEFARDEINSGNKHRLNDQDWIFAHQHHRIQRLEDSGIEYVITDSPLLLMLVYADNVWCNKPYLESFKRFVYEVDSTYNSYNIFIQRNDQFSEEDPGRVHSLEESKKIDDEIITMLTYHKVPYKKYNIGERTISNIYSDVDYMYKLYNEQKSRPRAQGLEFNKYSRRGH